MQDLELDKLVVVYPGSQPYSLAEGINVVPLARAIGKDSIL
jgi:hypothetical protein